MPFSKGWLKGFEETDESVKSPMSSYKLTRSADKLCSINILMPNKTSTMPPVRSALALNLTPKILPIFTPLIAIAKVIVPIKAAAEKFVR
jgi:hypothetical protein